MICPHKTTKESIIELPYDTKYIKFCRVILEYNEHIIEKSLNLFKKNNLPDYDEIIDFSSIYKDYDNSLCFGESQFQRNNKSTKNVE